MASGVETTADNAWVESYLNALLTYGLSAEYATHTKYSEGPNEDVSVYSRYYVRSLLNLDEEALKNAWSKAVSSTKQGGEKDARLQYLSWRIWHLKRKKAQVEYDAFDEETGNMETNDDSSDSDGEADDKEENASSKLTAPKQGDFPLQLNKTNLSVRTKSQNENKSDDIDAMVEEYMMSPTNDATPHSIPAELKPDRLYIVMISLHGLVRGDRMELGRDSDTGGQVKYVVELAKAMSLHPAVFRVDLLTRMIKDPEVDQEYGMEEECIAKGRGELGGSYIVRLPCGPTEKYIPKEQLWPHVREFADRGILYVNRMLGQLAESGRRCELYCIHGHYADAGEAAVLMSSTLGVPQITTGHSLGRNKLEHLLSSGGMTRSEIEATYKISRRIEAEERCLDVATMVFTSTQQEVDEQWGLYDGYNPKLARVLRFRRSYGRHMPFMKVSPPGLDFSNLKVTIPEDPVVKEFEEQRAAMVENELPFSPHSHNDDNAFSSPVQIKNTGGKSEDNEGNSSGFSFAGASYRSFAGSQTSMVDIAGSQVPRSADIIPNGPPIWQDIARFLRNPLKPAILAMSRPDSKKNITTLVKAFGEHVMLRELANLVLIMGNRDTIDSMPSGSQKVLTQVLKLIDAYDLYGSVAYPKHHCQKDISDIYLFAGETRGVFVNIALQEPFGLTVIEAAAHGVPTVATCNGGPVDIMSTLHHGVVVEPTDSDAVANALLSILTSPETWDSMSSSGVKNIMAYSWPAHCKRYMESMGAENRFIKSGGNQDRTLSGLMQRRLSRLNLLGIVDTEGVPQSPQPESQFEMHRNMSTPGDITPLLSGQTSPRTLKRNTSGITSDDFNVIHSMKMEAALQRVAGERKKRKHKFVVIPLDNDRFASDVASYIQRIQQKLRETNIEGIVGIGILTMLGFESLCDKLSDNGVNMDSIDFLVCNSGADIWIRQEDGQWIANEEYENLIDFCWDRTSLHRMLKKVISSPSENSQRLPRLKELLYNVGEEPEVGIHPRHVCLELDPETQQILASGMGPKARSTKPLQLAALIVARLKRKLRSKGFRANYTLQVVPDKSHQDYLSVLHITPIRASRPLALRFLAQFMGMEMSDFILIAFPACITTGTSASEKVFVPWTSDANDLIGGMQKVQISVMDNASSISVDVNSLNGLNDALGISLEPWAVDNRINLKDINEPDSSISGILHILLSQK